MRPLRPFSSLFLVITLVASAAACTEDDGHSHNEGEVITTVTLRFTPSGGGDPLLFEVDDPDGDGGDPPLIDPVDLAAGGFTLAVGFENRLEDPPEIITDEI